MTVDQYYTVHNDSVPVFCNTMLAKLWGGNYRDLQRSCNAEQNRKCVVTNQTASSSAKSPIDQTIHVMKKQFDWSTTHFRFCSVLQDLCKSLYLSLQVEQ